jgi:hypothetical protein
MNTIDLQEFTENFMEISNRLTNAEIRMLYLLITEPDVIKLSQQEFADKIGTHRRTINIGLKKLLEHKYISDIDEIELFMWAFRLGSCDFLYEGFFRFIAHKKSLPERIKCDRKFIIQTIEKGYPDMKFYFLYDREPLSKDVQSQIIKIINGTSGKHPKPKMNEITVNINELVRLKGIPLALTKEMVLQAIQEDYPRCLIIEIPIKQKNVL